MLERERTQLERDYSERHERDRTRLLAELNSARSKGAAELSQTRGENERLRQQELSVNSFVPVHRDSILYRTVQYSTREYTSLSCFLRGQLVHRQFLSGQSSIRDSRVYAYAPTGSSNACDVYSACVCSEQKQTLEENLAARSNAGVPHSEDTRQRVAQVTQMLRLLRMFAYSNSHSPTHCSLKLNS